jgi:hypothetical protein
MLKVGQKVELHKTGTPDLDGSVGTLVGTHGEHFPIVLFDKAPEGYDPAICIIDSCVKAV